MNLFADESVDQPVVDACARTAMMSCLWPNSRRASLMTRVLREANGRAAILVTADKDFGELVFRQGVIHSGVILLRLAGLSNTTKGEIVADVCRLRGEELIGSFTVISPGQVRIRRRL